MPHGGADMKIHRRWLLAAAPAALVPTPAAAQFPFPSAEDLARRARREAEDAARRQAESTVARALFPLEEDSAQLRPMVRALDHVSFGAFADMRTLPRTLTGGFRLRPGAWQFLAESYCLKAGSYERSGGAGYRSGALSGRVGPYVRTVLANTYAHPQVSRQDTQWLLWGVINGVEIRHMQPNVQAAAAALLTPQQIADLNGGVAGFVPPQLTAQALRSLPAPVRAAYDAQRRMRDIAARPSSSYADIERIAVLRGAPPRGGEDVPPGRWNYHPSGFFIRYESERYAQTLVQIVVGERFDLRRDSLNRITELRFRDGASIRTSYREAPPLRSPQYPGIAAYAFARIELQSPGLGGMRRANFENVGFAWSHERRRRAEAASPFALLSDEAGACQGDVPVIDVTEGAGRAREMWERGSYYRDRFEGATRPPSDEDIENIQDMDDYREGIETATTGDTGERLDWIAQLHERFARALARATEIINGAGEEDGATYEPSSESGFPSESGYVQRRGVGGRDG